MSSNDRVVRAAGGVVTRTARDGTVEVLVVHRPRYDDWSLPKGKLEPGESAEDAARREIEEETGVRVEIGARLADVEYVDRHGRPKVVHYWLMRPLSERPWAANDEIDATCWITVGEAETLLTYEHDRRLVAAVGDSPGECPA